MTNGITRNTEVLNAVVRDTHLFTNQDKAILVLMKCTFSTDPRNGESHFFQCPKSRQELNDKKPIS